jgi:hypothetical protein
MGNWGQIPINRFVALIAKLTPPLIFVGRNLYDPALVSSLGFEYLTIGR